MAQVPHGGIGFDGEVRKKSMDGGMPPPPMHPMPPPQLWETLKLFIKKGLLEEMESVNDNASAFVHLNIKINK